MPITPAYIARTTLKTNRKHQVGPYLSIITNTSDGGERLQVSSYSKDGTPLTHTQSLLAFIESRRNKNLHS